MHDYHTGVGTHDYHTGISGGRQISWVQLTDLINCANPSLEGVKCVHLCHIIHQQYPLTVHTGYMNIIQV